MNIGKRRVDAVAYIILGLGALLILFPMYITVVTTFKTMQESANSFFTLPKSFYLGNYKTVLDNPTLWYAYGNTIYIFYYTNKQTGNRTYTLVDDGRVHEIQL